MIQVSFNAMPCRIYQQRGNISQHVLSLTKSGKCTFSFRWACYKQENSCLFPSLLQCRRVMTIIIMWHWKKNMICMIKTSIRFVESLINVTVSRVPYSWYEREGKNLEETNQMQNKLKQKRKMRGIVYFQEQSYRSKDTVAEQLIFSGVIDGNRCHSRSRLDCTITTCKNTIGEKLKSNYDLVDTRYW